MPKVSKAFGDKVTEVFEQRDWSLRAAKIATGVDHTTLSDMKSGVIPTRGTVIQWAQGIKQDINEWLELAEYQRIPPELVASKPGDVLVLLEEGVKYSALSPERKRQISETIKDIIEELQAESDETKSG